MPIGWKVITMTSTLQTLRLEAAEQVYKVFSVYSLKVWLYIFKWSSYLFIYLYSYLFIFASDIIFIVYKWTKERRQVGYCFSYSRHPFFPQVSYGSLKCQACFGHPWYEAKTKTSQEWCKNSVHWTCTWLANNSASAPIKRQGWRGRVLVPGWFARAQTAGSLLDAEDFPWRRIQ